MILGMSVSTFTVLHVALSLIAIAAGMIALPCTARSQKAAGLTGLFLLTTLATSATGFLFNSTRLGLGHAIGVVSMLVLVPTLVALYRYRLAGAWRAIYVVGATLALYLNVFIGVLQAFRKIAVLQTLAPAPFAPPVVVALLAALAICVALGTLALRGFSWRREGHCPGISRPWTSRPA